MNQDQVKSILLQVEESPAPFSLVFSGKANKKVNGLYKPDTAEIVLHNKNFESDNQLLYTALHEYAHHLHYQRKGGIRPNPYMRGGFEAALLDIYEYLDACATEIEEEWGRG